MKRPAAEAGSTAGEAGFTLVEVLVAFTIIALTLTMAMRVLAEGANIARRAPAQADRIEEAASILSRMVADPASVPGEVEGVFSDGATWHARSIDVTARVAPKSQSRLVRIEFFLGRPVGRPALVTLAIGPPRS